MPSQHSAFGTLPPEEQMRRLPVSSIAFARNSKNRMRTMLLGEKRRLSDLKQAVYQAYDVMFDSAKEGGPGHGTSYDEKLVSAYQAACKAYLRAKLRFG
jgi:hypothetical protein